MFGKKNALGAPDIEKDRKRRKMVFTVTFTIAAVIIFNFVLYFVTKV